jgi:hypothetical protein
MGKAQIVIAFVVLAVWVASLIVRVLHPSLATNFTSVDAALLLVFGALHSAHAIRKSNGPG